MSFDQLVTEIEKLTPSEQAGLMDRLIEGMGQKIDSVIERSHLDEISRRRQGSVSFIPADEVLRDVRLTVGE